MPAHAVGLNKSRIVGSATGASILGISEERFRFDKESHQAPPSNDIQVGSERVTLPNLEELVRATRIAYESSRGASGSSDNEGTRGR